MLQRRPSPSRLTRPIIFAIGHVWFAAVVAVVLCCASAAARAQEHRAPAEVTRMSNQALDLARQGRMEDAMTIWRDLLADLDGKPAADVHLNLGIANKKVGHLPEAWFHLSQYLREYSDKPKVVQELKSIESTLKKERGKVTLTCDPTDAVVRIEAADGEEVVTCPATWWLAPGKHSLKVEKKGFEPAVVQVEVAKSLGDSSKVVRLRPVAAIAIVGPDKPGDQAVALPIDKVTETPVDKPADKGVETPVDKPVDKGAAERVDIVENSGVAGGIVEQTVAEAQGNAGWQILLLGVGGALAITGGIYNYVAVSRNNDLEKKYPTKDVTYQTFLINTAAYDKQYDEKVNPFRTTAWVMYGVGGSALLGGLVWWLLDEPSAPSITIAPLPNSGAMVGISW